MKVRVIEQTIFLEGSLDEFTDLENIPIPPAPVEINCRNVVDVTSIGIRNFMKLIYAIGLKNFYYSECSLQLVDCINTFNILLGANENGRIESFYLPYRCTHCHEEEERLIQSKGIEIKQGNRVTMKVDTCKKCGSYLTPLGDLADIVEFIVFQKK